MMKEKSSLFGGRPSGQALPEFAQVAILFFLLLFGIFEIGTIVYRYNTVSMAAREAARYAIVHDRNSTPDPSVAAIAMKYAPFLSSTDVTVTYPQDLNPHLNNQFDVLVTITHNYTQNIPLMSAVTLNLTSSSQMLMSQ